MTARNLGLKITAGQDDPERCNQAFNVAAAAVVSGVSTSLWLTGEASWFALPGRARDFTLPHAPPLADLLARVLAVRSTPRAPVPAAAASRPPSRAAGRPGRGCGPGRGRAGRCPAPGPRRRPR